MEQSELLIFLVNHLERINVRYFITGSHATIAFGEPRFTNDIDVVVDLDQSSVETFCAGFPEDEFYLNRNTVRQEIERQGMFNVIHPQSGLKIDFIIPSQGVVDELRFERSLTIPVSETVSAKFSSPEDIILQKLSWHRMGGGERHLADIAGIIKVRRDQLDVDYIEEQAKKHGFQDLWQQILLRSDQ